MAVIITVQIVAIGVIGVILAPCLNNSERNRELIEELKSTITAMQTQLKDGKVQYKNLNHDYLTLKASQNRTEVDLTVLKSSQDSSAERLKRSRVFNDKRFEELSVLHKYVFHGFGYGVDKIGRHVLETCDSNSTITSISDCLLWCYEERKTEPSINGINVYRDNMHCCCEKACVGSRNDTDYFHYLLT